MSRFRSRHHVGTSTIPDVISETPISRPEMPVMSPNVMSAGKEFREKLIMTLLMCCSRSTVHGLNHFANSKSGMRKWFWFCISTVTILACVTNFFRIMEKYFSRPVLTNVLHDHDVFSFPDITVCLTHSLYIPPRNSTQYRQMEELYQAYQQDQLEHPPTSKFRYLGFVDYLYFKRRGTFFHPPWSAIVFCEYQAIPCSWRHFTVTNLWPYGNCFTFNASAMNMSHQMESRTTLTPFRPDFKVVLYKARITDTTLTRTPLFSDPHNSITVPSGAFVILHEANTQANIGDSFLMDDSTQVDLKITRITHIRDPRTCQLEREFEEFVNALSGSVRRYKVDRHDCYYREFQRHLVERCGCVAYHMPLPKRYADVPLCIQRSVDSSLQLRVCYEKIMSLVNETHEWTQCLQDFCEHFLYTPVVSHSKFPAVSERSTHNMWLNILAGIENNEKHHFGVSELAQHALLPERNVEGLNVSVAALRKRRDLLNEVFLDRNFLMLRIVPSAMYMDVLEEVEEYPLSRLLSDVGGCMGLYVGASLITIFEFFDLLYDLADILQRYARHRRLASQRTMGTVQSSPILPPVVTPAPLWAKSNPMHSSRCNRTSLHKYCPTTGISTV